IVKRRRILENVVLGLLERHEHATFTVPGAIYEELQREQRLPAARPSADERRPTLWKSASGNLVEAGDARRDLGQRRRCRGFSGGGLAATSRHLRGALRW